MAVPLFLLTFLLAPALPEGSSTPELVHLRGGTFRMGSASGAANEKPMHRLMVSPFSIGKYEVSQAQYQVFVKETQHRTPEVPEPMRSRPDVAKIAERFVWKNANPPEGLADHPVVLISIADAEDYCRWLSKKWGKTVRLPTEAEWEFAARGGLDEKKYPWGDDLDHNRANYLTTQEEKPKRGTMRVGSFAPNAYGLFDMCGNAWEFIGDGLDQTYYSRTSTWNPFVVPGDPKGPAPAAARIVRGGAWVDDNPSLLTVSHRHEIAPVTVSYSLGFRIVVPDQEHVALRCGRVFDPKTGKTTGPAVILVEGDRIIKVSAGAAHPEGVRVIDLTSMTVLPGLIDAHTHITYHFDAAGHYGMPGSNDPRPGVSALYSAENARWTIEQGITTLRNLGAVAQVDLDLRDAIQRGEIPGPWILASGEAMNARAIPDSADKAARLEAIRKFVQARVRERADVIKVFQRVNEKGEPNFNEEEIRAAVEEASAAGIRVAVHAHEAAAIKAAVRGGCASIEHGSYLDDEAVRLMVERHTALVPTLFLPTHYIDQRDHFTFGASAWDLFEKLRSHNFENMMLAKKAGVRIVAGSDAVAGVHGQNARELEWMVRGGLTPLEVIRAATIEAADLLGIGECAGAIEPGKVADLIAVRGDPVRDITELQRIQFVMKSGRVVRPNS